MADYSVKFIRRVKDFEEFIMDSWPVRNPCDYDDIGQYIWAIYQEISEIIDEGELDGIYVSEWLDYEEGKKYVDEVLKSKIVENYYWNCGDDDIITENVNSEDVIDKLVNKLYDYTIGTKQVKNNPRMFTTSIYFTNKNDKHPEIEPIYFTWELDSVWYPKKLSFSESNNGKIGIFKKLGANDQFYEWAREKAKKHAEKRILDTEYLMESENKNAPFVYGVEKSKIHGLGLVASNDIQSGGKSMICQLLSGFKQFYTDLGRYINHSTEPNVKISLNGNQVIATAIKNILKGEEITCNYDDNPDGFEKTKNLNSKPFSGCQVNRIKHHNQDIKYLVRCGIKS